MQLDEVSVRAANTSMKTDQDNKNQNQQRVFDAFLQTVPYEIRRFEDWTNRGHNPPIDFVQEEQRIGVELTEWRAQEQSKWVEQRDTFRDELQDAIRRRGLTQFGRGGAGYTPVIYLENGSPRLRRKHKIINNLLSFLDDFVRINGSRFSSQTIVHIPASELPTTVRPEINSVSLHAFPLSNTGIVVSGTPFNPQSSALVPDNPFATFLERVTEKAIEGAHKYLCEKANLQLRELWLVIHYSSPDVYPEPLIEMDIGYAGRESQKAAGAKLKAAIDAREDITRGPFDRIYFLVDCQPDPVSQLIFSKQS
jgi:hypothetical protein